MHWPVVGDYFMVGGTARTLLRLLTLGSAVGALTGTRLGVLIVRQGPEHFSSLVERIRDGAVRVRIDRVFPLEQVPAALAYHGEGRALGKVVVAVRDA